MKIALNKVAMNGKREHAILIFSSSILFFSTMFLFVQNNYYRKMNRKLILENDSIISENIHLKDTLKREAAVGLSIKKAKTD
jgi:hypothetical protein